MLLQKLFLAFTMDIVEYRTVKIKSVETNKTLLL